MSREYFYRQGVRDEQLDAGMLAISRGLAKMLGEVSEAAQAVNDRISLRARNAEGTQFTDESTDAEKAWQMGESVRLQRWRAKLRHTEKVLAELAIDTLP